MKKLFLSICALALTLSSARATVYTQYVNPLIGTGAVDGGLSGNNYPGATLPFGMVQLSPDTREAPDWAQASGYDYNDTTLYGFSHTRLSGTGASDLIDLLMMPVGGTVKEALAQQLSPAYCASSFSHQQERAAPGYYEVFLQKPQVKAQLTATHRVGIHRYEQSCVGDFHLLIDLNHSANKESWGRKVIQSQIRRVDSCTIEGFRIITGWAKLRKVYYQIKFATPITDWTVIDGNREYRQPAVVNGTNLRALFTFAPGTSKELLAKVAISPVSVANAQLNMEEEAPHFDYQRYVTEADAQWEELLSKVQIGADKHTKELFYTALYHTLLQPNTFSDVNGQYMAADYSTRQLPTKEEQHYTTFSLWDTFRAAHPLYTLIATDRVTHFVNSLLRHYDAYGYLPVWQLWGQDNYCMIGNHSIPVIVDAVMKGIDGIDVERAYEAIRRSSLTAHPNSPFEVWEKYGYMPENIQTQSVSITLEQAYDDWCVAQLAKKLNREDDYRHFLRRSEFYRNLYHPHTHFFQPKDDKGAWMEPFDPYKYGANGGYPFTEGNAWQYYWYVPHNIPALITLTGGKKAFEEKLDTFFTSHHRSGERNDNASGFIGQYAHGNEPSHHVAYLYNHAGQPKKAQRYIHRIMTELYNNSSSGYAGNDDCGEMSAWYVFSALGFYPVNPADGNYIIGTPLVDNCLLRLANGKEFRIDVKRKSPQDIYIRSVELNGTPLKGFTLAHRDLMKGGTLTFHLTNR